MLMSSQDQNNIHVKWNLEDELQEVENGTLLQSSAVDAKLVKEEVADPIDSETGQVLQIAQVVMNMLDVTKPGILEEEEKKKLPPDVESALVQQVLSLTPEQFNSLPAEQKQQVIQLQQALRRDQI